LSKMHETSPKGNNQSLHAQLNEIIQFIENAVDERVAVHEVEAGLWSRMLSLGRELLEMFFTLHGDGDEGEQMALPDGREVGRLEQLHKRPYLSVFGEYELWRVVYGTREGQKIEYAPLDERLQLPASKFSHLLQDWNQSSTLEMSFKQASALLEKILGLRQSVHSLERSGRKMSEDVAAFWEAQSPPPEQKEGALLVCTADGKGVPMRKAAEQARIEGVESNKGVRPGSKKMALLGAVYTIDPYLRTPEDVLDALFRKPKSERSGEQPSSRPKPCFKRVRAALMRDRAESTAPQVETIFGWMAQEVDERTAAVQRPLILLMDGQESLWNAGLEYLPEQQFEVTEILDLLHAVSYVWQAARLFHPTGSSAALRLVRKQVKRILSGKVDQVILSLRRMARRRGFSEGRLEDLERICGYFRNNAERMAYDEYLAAGYPIASGVIEGACRTVVNDRMERSGMRWVFKGAHAMLGLRSIHLSVLWDDFIQFHIAMESQRLYPDSAANDDHIRLLQVA